VSETQKQKEAATQPLFVIKEGLSGVEGSYRRLL
jgi:hypothetical protein